jgi:Putative transposase
LFRSSAETLLEVARDPSHLGAEIGFFSVLHTWNQKLGLHPHVHCVVPAGGLSLDHTHWIKNRYAFFLPVKVLSRVFRGKFVAALKRAFRWRDSAHNNEQKLLTLSLDEFLRRFLLHLLPKGFVRIRHFGFLAHRRRAVFLPLCFHLLGSAPQEPQTRQEPSAADGSHAVWFCPQCGGPMIILERLTADQIQLRSPPLIIKAVA